MERTKLEEVIKRIDIRNVYAADYIRKNTANLDFSLISEDKFDVWFNGLMSINYFRNQRYPSSSFVNAFKAEFHKGTFNKDQKPKEVIQPGVKEDLTTFEPGIDEWIKQIYDLSGEYPEAAAFDKNSNLRGYFDGKGGFYYTDGTVSKKCPSRKERIKSEPSIAPDAEQKILEALNSKTSGEENPV